MKIRVVFLPCLVVLAAVTEFANVSFAADDYHNCDPDWSVKKGFACSAQNQGSPGLEQESHIFTFGTFGNDQSGILTNIGTLPYDVFIEQGLRFEPPVRPQLKPGETYHFGAYDKFSLLYSLVIRPPYADPNARGWIVLDQPSSSNKQCVNDCTTNFNGCHQGCGQIPNSGPLCLAGCDSMQAYCLAHCPP